MTTQLKSLKSSSNPEEYNRKAQALKLIAAHEDFAAFIRLIKPDYRFNWHHYLIIEALEDILAGRIQRLIITAPPRSGKSEIVSRLFPAYALGRDPDISIIACSYTSDLATRMNRDVQRYIDSPAYRELFPGTQLSGKNVKKAQGSYLRNSEIFEVVGHRGTYRGAGVGGGITGLGFKLGIIDDPFKDRASANSATIRQSVWDWYTSTFRTRAEPNAAIVVMHTRWHEDDLVGRLLEHQKHNPDADQWEVINLPAIADGELHPRDPRQDGEALWPGKYPLSELQRIRSSLGEYDFASLYQQRPVPLGGGIIRHEWWRYYARIPTVTRKVWAWDTAFKTGSRNDYSVGVLLGTCEDGYLVLDVQRHKLDYPDLKRVVLSCWERDPANALVVEDAASGQSLIQELQRTTSLPILKRRHDADKISRLSAVLPQIESGRVMLPMTATWLPDFLAETGAFPSGSHDDQVDALVYALQYLTENKSWQDLYGAFA